nr:MULTISPECIES: hypothetical protein [Bacillus]
MNDTFGKYESMVSSGTSRAKTTVFTNRDLVKQASEEFMNVVRRSSPQLRQASAKSSRHCVV